MTKRGNEHWENSTYFFVEWLVLITMKCLLDTQSAEDVHFGEDIPRADQFFPA